MFKEINFSTPPKAEELAELKTALANKESIMINIPPPTPAQEKLMRDFLDNLFDATQQEPYKSAPNSILITANFADGTSKKTATEWTKQLRVETPGLTGPKPDFIPFNPFKKK